MEITANGVLLTPELKAEVDAAMLEIARMRLVRAERQLEGAIVREADAHKKFVDAYNARCSWEIQVEKMRAVVKEEELHAPQASISFPLYDDAPVLAGVKPQLATSER